MLLCYAPVVHWIWGGGILAGGGILGDEGVVDFAGGIVVHETAGIAALIIAFCLGPRRNKTTPPHNPGYVMIGAAMLWVGWFGFNGGSQLAADGGQQWPSVLPTFQLLLLHLRGQLGKNSSLAKRLWSVWSQGQLLA